MRHKRFRLAAQRPANAQDVEAWKLRGAYDDAIRIPADVYHDGFAIFLRKESSRWIFALEFAKIRAADIS